MSTAKAVLALAEKGGFVIRNALSCSWFALAIFITGSAFASIVDIGGDPVYTQQDVFTADDWAVTVTSFVYDSTSSSLPAGIGSLDPEETLFVYFLDMENGMPVSVNNFNVGNPDEMPVSTVGWLGPLWVIPVVDGNPTTDTFQDPYLYGYSGPAQATVYTFSGNLFDPWCTLDPNEYSLVYFIAQSTWGPVSATISGGGVSDNQMLPGPAIPEPSLLIGGFFGLGLLLRLRRR